MERILNRLKSLQSKQSQLQAPLSHVIHPNAYRRYGRSSRYLIEDLKQQGTPASLAVAVMCKTALFDPPRVIQRLLHSKRPLELRYQMATDLPQLYGRFYEG